MKPDQKGMVIKAMKKEILLEELREVCKHIGYTIRFEKGDFDGGG